MHRLLKQGRWLRAIAGVLLFTLACAALADWQWHRHESAARAAALVHANYSRPPVPVTQLLPVGSTTLLTSRQWRPVVARGRYARGETVLVRDADDGNGNDGFLVLVPLRLTGGGVLLVDRGWIARRADVDGPVRVPAPPGGTVRVVARLRPAQGRDEHVAPAGQVRDIDVTGSVRRAVAASATSTARADAGAMRAAAYGQAVSESPGPARAPQAEAAPSTDEGPYLAYAVQWCLFVVGAWSVLVVHARRRAREDDIAAGRRAAPSSLVLADPLRRRSDEELEDLSVDAAERAHALELSRRWAELERR